ncbi:sugar phosphate nucleotidyltransferase [Peribacillus simplex]|uniref:sugar phosphate nucleotidyltransferase n=1 Tax=Peribacillus simplex TaxID=1478 RepID=UPI003D9B2E33
MAAENFITKDKFVVILGDNIFEDSLTQYADSIQKQKMGARVLLKEVNAPSRFGVTNIDQTRKKIVSILEKPSNPPSTYCVTGIYMYDETVFELIKEVTPSHLKELEITDSIIYILTKASLDMIYYTTDGLMPESTNHFSQPINCFTRIL